MAAYPWGVKNAWSWLKANLSAVLASVVAILGAGIFWEYHRRKVRSLEDLVETARFQEQLKALRAKKAELSEVAEAKHDQIARIDAAIVENKRAVVAIHEKAEKMNTREILEAFDKLGYK